MPPKYPDELLSHRLGHRQALPTPVTQRPVVNVYGTSNYEALWGPGTDVGWRHLTNPTTTCGHPTRGLRLAHRPVCSFRQPLSRELLHFKQTYMRKTCPGHHLSNDYPFSRRGFISCPLEPRLVSYSLQARFSVNKNSVAQATPMHSCIIDGYLL